MDKPWFAVNKIWGWYPTRWQGFLLISLMFFGVGFAVFYFYLNSLSVSETLIDSFPFVSLIVSLTILITSIKGAKPEFGKNNKENYSPDNPKAYILLPFLSLLTALYYFSFQHYLQTGVIILVSLILFQVSRNLKRES